MSNHPIITTSYGDSFSPADAIKLAHDIDPAMFSPDGPGAYERASNPLLAQALDVISGNGWYDEMEELTPGDWVTRIGRFLLYVDSVGFRVVTTYPNCKDAQTVLEAEVDEANAEMDSDYYGD